jgi:ribosomal protein L11 methyltransferase
VARTWPALHVSPVPELFEAALIDHPVVAIDEHASDAWRVFFDSDAARDRAASTLRAEFPELAIDALDVPDENWAARSQAGLRAVLVGRLVVAPPWDIPAIADPSAPPPIVIQPSMGFGTGHHATTRLCLAALQRLDLHGCAVLDVGTGSGVLAIAASLLGARDVVGVDDDADAIASARENLDLNPQVRVRLAVADLKSLAETPADVVVANLTGGLLLAEASTLQRLSASGGRLVLSGLMADEESAVVAAFPARKVEHRAREDEWVCVVLR